MNRTDEEMKVAVLEDIRCHQENNVSLNPYSTYGSRSSWQDGYEGKPKLLGGHHLPYRRGQMAAKLMKENHENNQSI